MQTLQRTPLHDRHVELGARLVPFAGWEMPVQYEGVIAEHRAVRADCGVFDVSHMGELEVEGPRAAELLQSLLSNDLDRIDVGEAQYTLLTNERGGIVDDLIVYKLEPYRFLLIVNASNTQAGYECLKERELRGSDVRDVSGEYALLAVQGPRSIERLGLPDAKPFTFAEGELDGVECMVNRTGYTGETGVEELRRVKEEGPRRRLVAFVMVDKAIPRAGMEIAEGGEVTSGSLSPMLDVGIGMGYVAAAAAAPDSELTIDVRGRPRKARVVKKPIYKRDD